MALTLVLPIDNQTALEVACRAEEWKLVRALVNVGANIDTPFLGRSCAQPLMVKAIT
jgi:hypothetical protein